MSFDSDAVRAHFPALRPQADGRPGTAHFDSPGGTQVPEEVARAVAETLTSPMANRGTITAAEQNATAVLTDCRAAVGDLLATDPRGVIFGRSTTQLTFDLSRTLSASWGPESEVVVSRLDHDANVRPWVLAAERAGATVRWIDFDPETSEVDLDQVRQVITERTVLVAVTAASNLIGTRPPVAEIAALAHQVGALVAVDAVHAAAHGVLDRRELGADFLACSPYKFLGPHCGLLAADPELLEQLHPDKLLPSTDAVPERFELGTLPYELMAGTTAAIDFHAELGTGDSRRERLVSALTAIEEHEDTLRHRIEAGIAALPGVTCWSRAARRTPTLLLTFADRPATGAHRFLAERGINAPASSFYAIECAERLGLGADGGLRLGLAPYNNDEDVDRLLAALHEFVKADPNP